MLFAHCLSGRNKKEKFLSFPSCSCLLIFTIWAGYFLFLPFLEGAPPENRTKYIPPNKNEILSKLEKSRKLAAEHPERKIVCTKQEILIEIYVDFSCKIAETREFYLKEKIRDFPYSDFKDCFVEQFFADGSYKASHSPEKLSSPANSLLIQKFSRTFPRKKSEEFFLELFLDHPFPVSETILLIANTKNQKIYHGMTPPYAGRLPLLKKLRRNTYILKNIPVQKSQKTDERIRFNVSGLPSWRALGDVLLEKMEKKISSYPPSPLESSIRFPLQKALFLYEKAKQLKGEARELILCRWLALAGIKAYPAMGREGRNINMSVACDFFTRPLVCIMEQKMFRSNLWLDLSADKAGKVNLPGEYASALLLMKGASEITFIPTGKK